MSFSGSAARIGRLRRRATTDRELVACTAAVVTLIVIAWSIILAWYLMWGLLLVPYRIVRRNSRRRRMQEMRHRELLASMSGAATRPGAPAPMPVGSPTDRVTDDERDEISERLRTHLFLGQLDVDEFEERCATAHRARTRGDLDALIADLPLPAAPPPADTARPPRPPRPGTR